MAEPCDGTVAACAAGAKLIGNATRTTIAAMNARRLVLINRQPFE
ncbi:hypothetical protein ACFQX6_12045 [Streptosporangium lutulentum]